MAKIIVEPNYKRMLQSHISATHTAYEKYKKALINQLQNTSIGKDGNLVYYDGLQKKVAETKAEFLREWEMLNAFKVYNAEHLEKGVEENG